MTCQLLYIFTDKTYQQQVLWEEWSEPRESAGAEQGCLKEYTIAYHGKPMVAASPHSLINKIFGRRESTLFFCCAEFILNLIDPAPGFEVLLEKEGADCLLTECSKLTSALGLALQSFA